MMADENKKLVPVFIPPLANVLALAEQKKGSPLSEPEVKAIRDQSICIMMESADAEAMAEPRGFVDVNPANCWADWHRLRPGLVGGYLPRIILCLPGDAELRGRWEPILKAAKVEHEFRPHDQNMVKAFKSSSMSWPCFTPEDISRIGHHTFVLYVLSEHFSAAAAPKVSRAMMKLGGKLLEEGGFAIKSESSGISHSAKRWRELNEWADENDARRWGALFRAYVVYPIASAADLYTCGMHLLGAPDLIVSNAAIENSAAAGQSKESAAAELFSTFAIYLLCECSVGQFVSGHTFSINRDAPRYRVVWEPCVGYPQDNYFFNPFGRWRFSTP
jgi:hypothetical protein